MKILSVGAELFHANGRTDRRTDMTKPLSAFRDFAYAPKILTFLLLGIFIANSFGLFFMLMLWSSAPCSNSSKLSVLTFCVLCLIVA